MSIKETEKYDWSQVDGTPVEEFSAFSVARTRNLFADVSKQEQLMADTLQQQRLVVLVHGNTVVEYYMCKPDPNSPHRVRA
jgi:hypothetical protein